MYSRPFKPIAAVPQKDSIISMGLFSDARFVTRNLDTNILQKNVVY